MRMIVLSLITLELIELHLVIIYDYIFIMYSIILCYFIRHIIVSNLWMILLFNYTKLSIRKDLIGLYCFISGSKLMSKDQIWHEDWFQLQAVNVKVIDLKFKRHYQLGKKIIIINTWASIVISRQWNVTWIINENRANQVKCMLMNSFKRIHLAEMGKWGVQFNLTQCGV